MINNVSKHPWVGITRVAVVVALASLLTMLYRHDRDVRVERARRRRIDEVAPCSDLGSIRRDQLPARCIAFYEPAKPCYEGP